MNDGMMMGGGGGASRALPTSMACLRGALPSYLSSWGCLSCGKGAGSGQDKGPFEKNVEADGWEGSRAGARSSARPSPPSARRGLTTRRLARRPSRSLPPIIPSPCPLLPPKGGTSPGLWPIEARGVLCGGASPIHHSSTEKQIKKETR